LSSVELKRKEKQMPRVAGYCKLCRAEEIKVYGEVLNTWDDRHQRACFDAGCEHPPYYGNVVELTPEQEAEICKIIEEKLGGYRDCPQDDY